MRMKPSDYTQFKKCQPWGYYPPDVEKRIQQYEDTIQKLTSGFTDQRRIILELTQKIERLQDELREMHLQMSSLELPDASEAVEHFVLDDFRNYNNPDFDDIPAPTIVSTEPKREVKINNKQYNSNKNYEDSDDNDDDEDCPFIILQ